MTHKIVAATLIICGVIVGSIFVGGFLQQRDKNSAAETATQTAQPDTSTTATTPTTNPDTPTSSTDNLTKAGVAKHTSSSDCWIIVEKSVYDVTDFLNQHPGGAERITPYCGKDATTAFQTQGGEGSHSSTADSLLKDYLLGPLAN